MILGSTMLLGSGGLEIRPRMSDRLVKALSQRWHVEKVPQGQGALPMKTCGG
jgi:hypothetical protein